MFKRDYCPTQKRLPEFLCLDEINRLIDSVQDLRDKAILEIMFATGCRPKELREIRISKIDFEGQEIRVFGKDSQGAYMKERILLFTKRAGDLIKRYIPTREPKDEYRDILFLNSDGEGLSAKELNDMVKDYIFKILHKKIERPNASYILRHSFATMMYNRGVDLPYLSEFLGHSSFNSVQTYTHTGIERLMKAHSQYHPREQDIKRPTNDIVCLNWARGILKK